MSFPAACCFLAVASLGGATALSKAEGRVERADDYRIQLDTIQSGFDGRTCWMLPYAGAIPRPGANPLIVLVLQEELLSASDVYFGVNSRRTEDLGTYWTPRVEDPGLGRHPAPGGMTEGVTGMVLKWHPASHRLLGISETAYFRGDLLDREGPQRPAYSVYDVAKSEWTPWRELGVPPAEKFHAVNVGCCQRVDLPDGTVLLPVYFKAKGITAYASTVLRCHFDGRDLTYLGQGDELTLPFDTARLDPALSFDRRQFIARQSGLFEPSLTRFQGRYFLTMRNVKDDYVATGTDGQHFDLPREWTFDDGRVLDSENTQTHWVVHRDRLYLVYTRRGANNDRVFRHRAPLFMAQVDPVRLCLLRATERSLIPDRGAGLGGSVGVTAVSPTETWITTSEVMQAPGPHFSDYTVPQRYGANNRVYAARLIWRDPDPLALASSSP